ncbi:MAG: hypothetical protein KC468_23585 [Myxococcales bacterium]|nr:hypothetical protein [Myxococcales bacterium]
MRRSSAVVSLLLLALPVAASCSQGVSGPEPAEPDAPVVEDMPQPAPEQPPVEPAPAHAGAATEEAEVERAEVGEAAAEAEPVDPLAAYVSSTPRCRPEATRCFSIALHLTMPGGAPAQTVDWVSGQVRQANRLFAPIDVSVQVDRVEALPPEIQEIDDRAARDALGRERFSRGALHVFVTPRLADVDVDGAEIRGVHWRYRPDTQKRWIILSKIASDLVLSHEMGHFFGLPHSSYDISLMNKSPRDAPPWSERRFHDRELARMRRHRDAMVRSGMLVNQANDQADDPANDQAKAKPPGAGE